MEIEEEAGAKSVAQAAEIVACAEEHVPRLPEEYEGIQVNHCKNPLCPNYGKPASTNKQPRGRGAATHPHRDSYRIEGAAKNKPVLLCLQCGGRPPIKSNKGIYEEYSRMLNGLSIKRHSCRNEKCPNHRVSYKDNPSAYLNHGTTRIMSQRLKCRVCGRTFVIPKKSFRWHKKSHKNILVLKLLTHSMPLRDIVEVAELSPSSLYGKIDFLWRQCKAFAAQRESELPSKRIQELSVAVDRQEYVVNWERTEIKRNIVLSAIGSADNASGYVFGMHLNYDPELNRAQVDAEAEAAGELEMSQPFRPYARVWLTKEYEAAMASPKNVNRRKRTLEQQIRDQYEEAINRDDVESPDAPVVTAQLPEQGMQIHSEYTLYGHFFFLSDLLRGVEKINFYMDQESGIRSACFSAFIDRILCKQVDAFYVSINKDLDIHTKRRLKGVSDRELEQYVEERPHLQCLRLEDQRFYYLREHIHELEAHGAWKDEWLLYPFPNMTEPEKKICYMTNLRATGYDHDNDTMATLYLRATLHGIDRFFMQLRRRVSIFERPISTASSNGQVWYARSAYNPITIVKLLEIYRVYYNYVKVGKDKKTPAMRLGLSKGPIKEENLLYFVP